MNSTLKKTLQFSISLLIGILFFYFLYRNVDTSKMIEDLSKADYRIILLSMALGCLAHWSRGVRWTIALQPLGYKVQKRKAFVSVMVGYLMNIAFPRAGEVARCAFLKRTDDVPVETSFGSVIGERALDFIILVSVTAFTFLVEWDIIKSFLDKHADFSIYQKKFYDNIWLLWILILVGLLTLGLIYLYRKEIQRNPFVVKISSFLGGLWQGILSITKLNKQQQLFYLIHTIIIWACYHLMIYVLFFSIEATSDLTVMAGFTAMVMAGVGMVIPIPGGIGSFHFFVQQTIIAYGINETTALDFAFLGHTGQTVMIIVVGGISTAIGIYLWGGKKQELTTKN